MQHPKRKAEGFEERLEVLKQYENKSVAVVNAALDRYPLKKVARDDIVDALALAVTAAVSEGDLRVKPILLRIFIKIHHAKFFVTTITGNKLPSAKGTSFKTATFFMIFTLCLFNPNSF